MGLRDAWRGLWAREAGSVGTYPLGNTDAAYRALAVGYDSREISPQERERYLGIARRIYATDAVGGALADAVVARVVGAGLQWRAEDPAVQEAVTRFSTDQDNDLPGEFSRMVTELAVFGELVLPVFVTRENGDVRLGYLMPEQVEDVVWRAGDAKRAVAVVQKRPSLSEPRYLWVVPHPDPAHEGHFPPHPALTPEEEPHTVDGVDGLPVALPAAGGVVLPEVQALLDLGDVKVAGYAFYHRTGCLVSGRGRGLYWRTKDWLKALSDHVFAALRNSVLRARYVFTVTLRGASAEQIVAKQRAINANPPAPGSVLVKGDAEEWSVVSPGVPEAAGVETLATLVQKFVGLSEGVPSHEIGAEGDVNRNTASESRTAAMNRAKRFQREIVAMWGTWVSYLVDQKVYAGQLPEGVNREVKPVLPELDARDEGQVAQSVAQGVTAMVAAVDAKLVLEADARAYVYGLLGVATPEAEAFEGEKQARDVAGYEGAGETLEALIGGIPRESETEEDRRRL